MERFLERTLFFERNYSARYTTREIGLKLKVSPAGSYKSLKKLEQSNLVIAEKLGTGLFFHLNYQNQSAFYLACFVASINEEDIKELKDHIRAAIKSNNKILLITHHHDEEPVKKIASKLFSQELILFSEEEFVKQIITKDQTIVDLIKNMQIVYGTEYVIKIISKLVR